MLSWLQLWQGWSRVPHAHGMSREGTEQGARGGGENKDLLLPSALSSDSPRLVANAVSSQQRKPEAHPLRQGTRVSLRSKRVRCHAGPESTYWDPGTQRLWGREGRTSKEQLNGRLNSTHIFHEAMNLLRENTERQGRCDVSLRGWEEEDTGQRWVTGFQILRSLRPTKREIIFISITSSPVGVILFLSLVPGVY